MNLPKHIEERLDNKFKDVEFIIFEKGEWSHDIKTRYTTDEIKSFIAQILEEEKERIVGEIIKNYEQQLLTYKPNLRQEIYDYHLAKNQTDVINLTKKKI